ncbi:nesprin-1 [Anoplopoma fimbria]|uniref:nesprin-1 n=1 Tax=Anoplopoma fimbria TaxID=229290 RepID=UPI0023EC957B|nr:nesprin-1 [Anoplopoma fimbria]
MNVDSSVKCIQFQAPVSSPPDEKRAVQRRTFTRWMNVFLQRRDPPVEVHDLFTDIQDGGILMALLEELSGCKLLYRFRSSSHRIFRLNNISKALAFLDDRHVKLPGIDASGIADGIPSAVLKLVWNMILYFQVKVVSVGLQRHLSSSLSSLSMSSYPSSSDLSPPPNDIGSYFCNTLPSKGRKAAREPKYHGKAIKTLLQWVQRCTSKFGVEVHDFGRSWRSGLAFLAMIKSINPALVDLRESLSRQPRENIQLAFTIAHHSLDIPPLLEPEDVSGTSPDEQCIITYVSMFLGHCSGTDEDHTTDVEVPEIPNFGSLESVSFGGTHTDDLKAQALDQFFEKSNEQLLWKRWARRSLGSPRNAWLHPSEATSSFNKKKSSILQPPSPLDAGIVGHDIRSWMENSSAHRGDSKPRADESRLSWSSEEGIYSLSALDSDEEDAYSYILDLNKEVFPPYNQLKRQVPRVEEETEEEMFLSGQQTKESKHLEVCKKTLKGSEHQEGSLALNVEPEVRAQSAVHRTCDWKKDESSLREMAQSIAVFDTEPEEDSRSREKDKRVVRVQSHDDGDYCEEERKKERTENARLVRHGCDKREALMDETKNSKPFDVNGWKIGVEKETEGGLLERCGQVIENQVVDNGKEEENLPKFEEGHERKSGKEERIRTRRGKNQNQIQSVLNLESFKEGVKNRIITDEAVYEVRGAGATRINTIEENEGKEKGPNKKELNSEDDKDEYSDEVMDSKVRTVEQKDRKVKIRRRELTGNTATTAGKTAPKNDTNGGGNIHGESSWTPACTATSQSFREGGFIPQSSAAPCDITPLELEMLLFLWILLYCCFIF